ncbi:MAG: polyprenyl synthetase family protein [Bacteroidaceae bacterium]
MYTSSEVIEKVNNALKAVDYAAKPEGLYEPVSYVLSIGGKRIRPVLLLMAYNLYKENIDNAMSAAVGIETYHNYTLLHDDLMDRAEVRRGKATVHKVWDDNTAILSGDSMLVLAYRYMIDAAKRSNCFELLDTFTTTALEIGEGQQYDMNFETRNDVCEEEYIEMIRLKTSVLVACGVKMGAMMAGASAEEANRLYEFGEKVGLAFQLQDDFLDVYGDPSVFGKKIGGDILCNKKTFLLINALNSANASQRAELEKWIKATDYDAQQKIDAVTALYNAIGTKQLSNQKVEYYFEEARQSLKKLPLPAEKKTELWHFVETLIGRDS